LALYLNLSQGVNGNQIRDISLISAQQTLFIPAIRFALNEQVSVAPRATL